MVKASRAAAPWGKTGQVWLVAAVTGCVLVCALQWPAPAQGAAPPPEVAWSSGLEMGQPGDWRPYGSGCALSVVPDDAVAGGHALQARFDDSSEVPWANKGAQTGISPGVPWAAFRYLLLHYRLDRPASALCYLLHDDAGNWWRAATETPVAGQWAAAAVSSQAFSFAWNDDPNMQLGRRDARIVELFVAAATTEVNTGARYELLLGDLSLRASLPDGLQAPEPPVPASEAALPPEEGDPFELQWRVEGMDERGFLLVGGQPFFPLGLYSCLGIDQASGAADASRFEGVVDGPKVDGWLAAIRSAGFNLLQTYTMQFYGMELRGGLAGPWTGADVVAPTTPEKQREGIVRLLDLCQAHGMKLMAGCAHPYCAVTLPSEAEEREHALAAWQERVRPNVEAWRDHQALLAWYLLDEPSSVAMPVADLRDQYRYLKKLDARHPLVVASCAATDMQYARALDVIAPDPYPIETGVPLRELVPRIRPLKAVAQGVPPMPQTWAVIQICQWVEGRRLPSEQEMRLLALSALSQGVTGLLFYEFQNYPDREPAHWVRIGRVVRSLQSVIPALLAPGAPRLDLPTSDRRVYALAKEVGEGALAGLWVIAANPSQNLAGEPLGLGKVSLSLAGFEVPEGAVAEALDEDETGVFAPGSRREVTLEMAPEGATIRDEFGPLGAHVYRIRSAQ